MVLAAGADYKVMKLYEAEIKHSNCMFKSHDHFQPIKVHYFSIA